MYVHPTDSINIFVNVKCIGFISLDQRTGEMLSHNAGSLPLLQNNGIKDKASFVVINHRVFESTMADVLVCRGGHNAS